MIYIQPQSTDAAFHFSVEEYLVRNYPFDEPILMIWQTERCVMLGNNQIVDAEINRNFAERENIQIVRRQSGGGTIFCDMGTLLYTVILPHQSGEDTQKIAREKVATPIVAALNDMGIPAAIEGRNDILVDGKKVSGIAQYAKSGRICTHGSLLFDADLEMLTNVLNVDAEKIQSKALKSVRSRVTNLREHMVDDCSTREFLEMLEQRLFSTLELREVELSEEQLTEIDRIFNEKYGNSEWTFERSPKFTFKNGKRFSGGRVDVYLDIARGVVKSCSICGDFLGISPIIELEEAFEGRMFDRQAFAVALDGISLIPYIGSITKDELLSCVFG